jgi:glycosyltransferase involved in cell wall biosynthesis
MPSPALFATGSRSSGSVAYVLKSFPRLSETFIASEIYRLEQEGLALRLFVIKRSHEALRHPVVDAIRSPRVHLPEAAPISGITAWRWLAQHAPVFARPLTRQIRRHPIRTARAAWHALAHAVRARTGRWAPPRKAPLKEFLQAAALADAIHAAGDVRHIHAHFCHSATTIAWLASMMTSLPLSFTAHAKDVYCSHLNPAGLLDRKLRAARFVVTCTEATRAYLQARTSTPVRCVYHGLDVEFARLCERPVARPRTGHAIRALAVGRLVHKKGFDIFIEACAILRARGVSIQARIVGESGEHETALRAMVAATERPDLVVFAGPMSRAQLFDEYHRADVFCLPCRILENGDRDGIPNVVAEAMACGLPVVTTDVSNVPELLQHGVNGIVVPPESPRAVADAIERLHADPALVDRISERARTRIRETFDGDVSVRALSALFQGGAA